MSIVSIDSDDVSTVSAEDTTMTNSDILTADAEAVDIGEGFRTCADERGDIERESVGIVEASSASSVSTVSVNDRRLMSNNNSREEMEHHNQMDSASSWVSYENEFDECFPDVCSLYSKITSLMDTFGVTVLSIEIPENKDWREVSLDYVDIVQPNHGDTKHFAESRVSGSSSDLYERDIYAAEIAVERYSFNKENAEARSASSHEFLRNAIHSSQLSDERDAACESNDQGERSYSDHERTQSYHEESDDDSYFASASETPPSDDEIDDLTHCSDDFRPYGTRVCLERYENSAGRSDVSPSDDDIDDLTHCSDDFRPYGTKVCLESPHAENYEEEGLYSPTNLQDVFKQIKLSSPVRIPTNNTDSSTKNLSSVNKENRSPKKKYSLSVPDDAGAAAVRESTTGQVTSNHPKNTPPHKVLSTGKEYITLPESSVSEFQVGVCRVGNNENKHTSLGHDLSSRHNSTEGLGEQISSLSVSSANPDAVRTCCQKTSSDNARDIEKLQNATSNEIDVPVCACKTALSKEGLSSTSGSISSSSSAVDLLQSFHQSLSDDGKSDLKSKANSSPLTKAFSELDIETIHLGGNNLAEKSFVSTATAHNDSCLVGMSGFVNANDLPKDGDSFLFGKNANTAPRQRRFIEESSCSSSSSIVDLLQSFQQKSTASNDDLHTSEYSDFELVNEFDGLVIDADDSAEGIPSCQNNDGHASGNTVCLDTNIVEIDVSSDREEFSSGSTVKLPRRSHSSKNQIMSLETSSEVDWVEIDSSASSGSASFESIENISNPHSDTVVDDNASDIATISEEIGWNFDESTNEYVIDEEQTKGVFPVPARNKYASGTIEQLSVPKIRLPKTLFSRLYDHQKVGVQWMASLHAAGVGGILGDDMGMGKTFQTLALLGGLMRNDIIRCALVICPVSCIENWAREATDIIRKCSSSVNIITLTSSIRPEKRKQLLLNGLLKRKKRACFVVAPYGFAGKFENLTCFDRGGDKIEWDYVILDEGHNIKNSSTKANKGCHKLCGTKTHRLLLTGTPIQNKLTELWTLFDWATAGSVLGKLTWFKNQFSDPIEQGRHQGVDKHTLRIAIKASEELHSLLKPHFLQRLKRGIFRNKLSSKQEIVVWTHISVKQREMYEQYLRSKNNQIDCILRGEKTSPLEEISWLKKLCGHPLLCEGVTHFDEYPRKKLLNESAKLSMLVDLIQNLLALGHRVLIFSQSTRMLDIISNVINFTNFDRIDGSTRGTDRQIIVDNFNNDVGTQVMLLSTKAAGIGINLTSADRSVIYDPSWNPAEDAQAVDRCYRIGQKKNVVVYRFIASGTVEEKMYEKQIFKDGIKNQVLFNGDSSARHFTKNDLKKMFTLAPKGECAMLEKFGNNIKPSKESALLVSHDHVVGLSSHDEVYSNGNVSENNIHVPTQQGSASNMVDLCENPHYPTQQGSTSNVVDLCENQKAATDNDCDQENHMEKTVKKLGKSARVIGRDRALEIIIPLNNRKLNSK